MTEGVGQSVVVVRIGFQPDRGDLQKPAISAAD